MAHTLLKHPEASIIGDVTTEAVTINRKGGSVTAILKQNIRGELNSAQTGCGARIDFGNGVSCVVVAPGEIKTSKRSGKIRIQRVAHGYMITLDDGSGEVVDPVTQKILSMYEEMIKAGKVKVLSPAQAHANTLSDLKAVDELIVEAKSRVAGKK
jgi:hypothetical protein